MPSDHSHPYPSTTLHNTTTMPEILPRDPSRINMVIIQTLNSKDSLTIRLFVEDSQASIKQEAVMVHQEDSRFHTPDPPEWLQFRSSKSSKCQLPRSLCTLLRYPLEERLQQESSEPPFPCSSREDPVDPMILNNIPDLSRSSPTRYNRTRDLAERATVLALQERRVHTE